MTPSEFTKKITKKIGGKKFILDLTKYGYESINVSILYNEGEVELSKNRHELAETCEKIKKEYEVNFTNLIHSYIDEKLIEIEENLKYLDSSDAIKIKNKIDPLLKENNFSNKINTGNLLDNFKNKFKKIKGLVEESIETNK